MANSIKVTFDLTYKTLSVSNDGGLTGNIIAGEVIAPDGYTTAYATAGSQLAQGFSDIKNFATHPLWTNSAGNLQRGVWRVTYTDSAATALTGDVTFNFNDTDFPMNIIEIGASTTQDSIVTPNIEMSIDCFSGELTVTDNSVYDINTISPVWAPAYTNDVYSPPNVGPILNTGTVYGSLSPMSITPIYKGTYTSYISGRGMWIFSEINSLVTEFNGLEAEVIVMSTVDGGNQIAVDCLSASLCDIWECIRDLNNRYTSASCTNERVAKKEKAKLERVMQLMTLTESALACGEASLADGYITEIKSITNCTSCS
jgi:hypothetical protein